MYHLSILIYHPVRKQFGENKLLTVLGNKSRITSKE